MCTYMHIAHTHPMFSINGQPYQVLRLRLRQILELGLNLFAQLDVIFLLWWEGEVVFPEICNTLNLL